MRIIDLRKCNCQQVELCDYFAWTSSWGPIYINKLIIFFFVRSLTSLSINSWACSNLLNGNSVKHKYWSISHLNSELSNSTSLAFKLSPRMPCLHFPSTGNTGRRLACPAFTWVLSGQCFANWTIFPGQDWIICVCLSDIIIPFEKEILIMFQVMDREWACICRKMW